MANKATITLNTGHIMPAVALGTWRSKPEEVTKAVEVALKVGYRHIDTAMAYGNEKAVGEGIKNSGVPRDQIFLTTKLNNPDHHRVNEALEESLKNLQVDYLDLYLMHWPIGKAPDGTLSEDFVETWAKMQKIAETGKVRSLGISNFDIPNLTKLLSAETTTIVPAVNQCEFHPYLPQPKLVAFLRSKGIHPSAYSPLGGQDSPVAENPIIKKIAEKRGKDPNVISLAWGIKKGHSVLPKSVTESRIKGNFESLDFELTDEEVQEIDNIKERHRNCTESFLKPMVVFHESE
ncbi:aldose reductase [Atractiella rhizophila]|nr:aldose reductase [Atractiella rhizophila]